MLMLSVRVVLKPCSDPGCVTRRCVFTQRVEPTFRKAVVSRRRRIGRSGEKRGHVEVDARSLQEFRGLHDRRAPNHVVTARAQLKPSPIHVRRASTATTSRSPTHVTAKDRAERFRAVAIPPIRVVLCGRAPRSKMNKTPLNFAQKDEEDLKKKKKASVRYHLIWDY